MPRHFPTTPPRGGAASALCRLILALLHLTMIATAHAAHQTLAIPRPVSRPYVASMGAPALRFLEAIPTPPVLVKPIASGPPFAATAPEVAEVTHANHEAAAATPPAPAEPVTPEPAAPTPTPKAEQPPAPTGPKPLPILPDDTRRKPQSQDFLPLFRFPGPTAPTEDSISVPTPPAPGTLPPSSATYQQH